MKLTCKVDQKAALLRGINAPHSTIVLDVDPAILSDGERYQIAEWMVDGHDLTRYGAELRDPSLDGLRESLVPRVAQRADTLRKQAAIQTYIDSGDTGGRTEDISIGLQWSDSQELGSPVVAIDNGYWTSPEDGSRVHYPRKYTIPHPEGWAPRMLDRTTSALLSLPEVQVDLESARVQHRAWFAAQEAERAARAAKDAEAKAIADAKTREVARLDAERLDTAVRVISERGTTAQQERVKRGLTSDGEPEKIARTILADQVFAVVPIPAARRAQESDLEAPKDLDEAADLPEVETRSQAADSLTDAQMEAYLPVEAAILAVIPDATVTPWVTGITRDSSEWIWVDVLCARARVVREGFTLGRLFKVE